MSEETLTADRLNRLIESGECICVRMPSHYWCDEVFTLFKVRRFFVESGKLLCNALLFLSHGRQSPESHHHCGTQPNRPTHPPPTDCGLGSR